jgi:hypothetical protein
VLPEHYYQERIDPGSSQVLNDQKKIEADQRLIYEEQNWIDYLEENDETPLFLRDQT